MSDWTDFLTDLHADRTSHGNDLRHLDVDHETIEAIWSGIEGADERAWMSMYTLGPDAVGRGTLARLAAAAHRGVDVRLIYDHVGSFALSDDALDPLRRAGGHVAAFHPVWPPWRARGEGWIRNHRKLLVLDGAAGFCGGMNLGHHFVHVQRDGRAQFDDTMVRIEGPAVHGLATLFSRTWEEATGEALSLPARPAAGDGDATVVVLETDPRRPETHLIATIGGAIRRARERVHITTPYFIPDVWLRDALQDALGRGVRVRILTAGRTDVALARLAGHAHYEPLLDAGAQLYEMQGRTIHTKKLTVDDAFCAVGSYNFDVWTSRHVLDASIATVAPALAASFEAEFADDLDHALPIDPDRWRTRGRVHRLAERAALVLARHL